MQNALASRTEKCHVQIYSLSYDVFESCRDLSCRGSLKNASKTAKGGQRMGRTFMTLQLGDAPTYREAAVPSGEASLIEKMLSTVCTIHASEPRLAHCARLLLFFRCLFASWHARFFGSVLRLRFLRLLTCRPRQPSWRVLCAVCSVCSWSEPGRGSFPG